MWVKILSLGLPLPSPGNSQLFATGGGGRAGGGGGGGGGGGA